MMFGCRHRWVEVGRTFTPPADRPVRAWGSDDVVDRTLYGFTNIEQRCTECGKVRVEQALGKVDAPQP